MDSPYETSLTVEGIASESEACCGGYQNWADHAMIPREARPPPLSQDRPGPALLLRVADMRSRHSRGNRGASAQDAGRAPDSQPPARVHRAWLDTEIQSSVPLHRDRSPAKLPWPTQSLACKLQPLRGGVPASKNTRRPNSPTARNLGDRVAWTARTRSLHPGSDATGSTPFPD